MLGLSEGKIVGSTFAQYFEDRDAAQSLVKARSRHTEATVTSKTGVKLFVSLEGNDLGEDVGGKLIVARDLSHERKALEIQALGKMYYDVATESKTPLCLAYSWLEDLQQCTIIALPRWIDRLSTHIRSLLGLSARKLNGPISEAAAKIMRQLRKVEITYDRMALYDEAKYLTPHKVKVDVARLIGDIIDDFPAGDAAKVVRNSSQNDLYVDADPYQLTFCVQTILSYLLRFALRSGCISFRAHDDAQGHIIFDLSGPFPERTLSRPYYERDDYRLWKTLADIGMGKNIVHQFVANQNGSFEEPQVSKGMLMFRFAIPSHR
jgi:hypothetical protein